MRTDEKLQTPSSVQSPPHTPESDFRIRFADDDFDQEVKELDDHVPSGHLPAGVLNFGNVYYTS